MSDLISKNDGCASQCSSTSVNVVKYNQQQQSDDFQAIFKGENFHNCTFNLNFPSKRFLEVEEEKCFKRKRVILESDEE